MPLAAHRVAVHPRDARRREIAMQLLLDLLRPRADKLQILAAALRARRWAPSARSCSSGTACGGRAGDRSTSPRSSMHSMRSPHARQATKLENPRRLSSSMVCSPISSRSVDRLHQPPRERRLLARLQKLLPHVDQLRHPASAAVRCARAGRASVLAALGVVAAFQARRGRTQHHARAAPAAPARWRRRARCSAASPAACSFRSCSSSTTISPRFCTGANTPDRVPTTTRRLTPADAPPLLGALGIVKRRVQNRHAIAETVRRTAPPPPASARSPAPAAARCGPAPGTHRSTCRYTSVLPDPVTPSSRNV